MDYYKRALALSDELIANRRYLHTNAEIGLHTPKARTYVLQALAGYGIEGQACGEGVSATIGRGGKTLLLRADMDALPMAEESGLPFACPTGREAHTCGHDLHTAMLLTAAKMLKETESDLRGTVKLMFQSGEETFEGSRNMIDHGILEDPRPDAALAYHVSSGSTPLGMFLYNDTGTFMFSVDGFQISIQGAGSHGAYPHTGVDPINIGVHIHLALQELIARESDPTQACALTIGQFTAGSAANIIPETAFLQGTIRTNHTEARARLVRRMREVAEGTAALFGGSARIEMISQVPPLVCDGPLTREMISYMQQLSIPHFTGIGGITASASEDFALIAEKIPSAYMYLSAGYADQRGAYGAHSPKVHFDENVLAIGAACFAHCAAKWLEKHQDTE